MILVSRVTVPRIGRILTTSLGQTKFYYDDVDAIRMPNYITRSNIDHQPFADRYGPLPAGERQWK